MDRTRVHQSVRPGQKAPFTSVDKIRVHHSVQRQTRMAGADFLIPPMA